MWRTCASARSSSTRGGSSSTATCSGQRGVRPVEADQAAALRRRCLEDLAAFGTVKEHAEFTATLEVPRPELKERSKAILDQLAGGRLQYRRYPGGRGHRAAVPAEGGRCSACAARRSRALPWLRNTVKAFELGFQTALEYRLNFLHLADQRRLPDLHPDLHVDGDLLNGSERRWCTATPTAR